MQISISNAIKGDVTQGGTPTPPSFASTKSFQFDGITDKFGGIATYNTSDNAEKITISSWINLDSTSNSGSYLCGVDGGSLFSFGIRLQTTTNTTCWVYVNNSGNNNRVSTNLGAIKNTGWHHLMICLDLSLPNASECQIFFDGISQTMSGYFADTTFPNATSQLQIGASSLGFLGGNVDEFAIWVGSDQRANVSEIWNGGLPNDLNTLPTAPQPTNWFRMGEFATWNGRAFSMTDVNNSYVVRSQGLNASDPNPTTDVPLFDNKSFTYDGNLDYVNLGDNNNLSFGDGSTDSPFSISSWWYMTDASNFRGFQKFDALLNCEYRLNGTANSLRFAICDGSFYNRKEIVFANLSTYENQWINVVATYNANGLNSGMKLYINGTQVSTTTNNDGTYVAMENTSSVLTISKLLTNYSNGKVNDTSLFNSELTQANVSTIFNGGVPNDISALSPLGYWRAEQVTFDGTNWTLIDQGSGGNNGLSSSMPLTARTSDVPLFDNKSFAYDGIADYVDMGNPTSLQITGALSISAWVKINTTNQVCILSKDDVTNRSHQLWGRIPSDGFPKFVIFNSSVAYTISGTTDLNDNQWHHVVAVFTPSTSLKMYIDGTLEGTNTTSIPSSIDNEPANFEIGRFGFGNYNLNGKVNDTSLFNSELTQANVTEIYNGGISNNISNLNPLGYWRSEFATWDGSNWTMIDQGSGANNGLTSSMPLTSRTSDVPT